jgi:hypothetical protein
MVMVSSSMRSCGVADTAPPVARPGRDTLRGRALCGPPPDLNAPRAGGSPGAGVQDSRTADTRQWAFGGGMQAPRYYVWPVGHTHNRRWR